MSKVDNNHPSKLDEAGNKRKRSHNSKRQTDNSTYKGISFNKRTSSGRPGSPHRYFDSSYDIFMEDTTSDNVLEATSSQQSYGIGNQVVHRHLNGLCIISAGNVIQQELGSASNDDNKEDGILQIKTIKYHIQPSKDSQSARGKMRTKKKKRKKQQSIQQNNSTATAEGEVEGVDQGSSSKTEEANNDGYVSPKDTLCTVTLSNGQEIQLKCCVEGTVIEINNRLVDRSNGSSSDTSTFDSSTTQGDVSLLMKEPLLDGYLAVIMPSRGVFSPRYS